MRKAILRGFTATKLDVSPRKSSPRVGFLGSGVGAKTLEALLKRGVNVEKVISDSKRDGVIGLASANDIPYEVRAEQSDITPGIFTGIDYLVVAFTDHIIPKNIIDGQHGNIIGVHASSLPQYRGGHPIEAALLDGKDSTNIVTFLISEDIDTGPILLKDGFDLRKYVRHGKGLGYIYQDVASAAGDLLARTLFRINKITRKEQNGVPSYSHKPTRSDLTIDWQEHTKKYMMKMMAAGSKLYTSFQGKPVVIPYIGEWAGTVPNGSKPGDIWFSEDDSTVMITTKNRGKLRICNAEIKSIESDTTRFMHYLRVAYELSQKNSGPQPRFGPKTV